MDRLAGVLQIASVCIIPFENTHTEVLDHGEIKVILDNYLTSTLRIVGCGAAWVSHCAECDADYMVGGKQDGNDVVFDESVMEGLSKNTCLHKAFSHDMTNNDILNREFGHVDRHDGTYSIHVLTSATEVVVKSSGKRLVMVPTWNHTPLMRHVLPGDSEVTLDTLSQADAVRLH